MNKLEYSFEVITSCNMCGEDDKKNTVLGQRMNKSQGLKPKSQRGITTSVMKCSNCGLIYSNPLPIPADLQNHYGIPPEDYWKESYFLHDSQYFAEQISISQDLLPKKEEMKALDIGAGLGKCMLSLEKAGFETYGLEPSFPFWERAIGKMNISVDKLKQSSLEDAEYPTEFFDFITFGAVLEHLYNPSQSIIKALSWLKPRGILHIEVPSSDYFIPKIFNLFYKAIGTNYVNNISPMHEPFHLYEFGMKSFLEHSNKNGYEIAFSKYDVCDIYYLPKMLHPPLKWYMNKTNKGMQLSLWLKKT